MEPSIDSDAEEFLSTLELFSEKQEAIEQLSRLIEKWYWLAKKEVEEEKWRE